VDDNAVLVAPPLRRRKPVAVEVVSTPTPPIRRRKPVEAVVIEETKSKPLGRFMLEGFNRPLPIYWQHHGAPDYVKYHAEEMKAYKHAVETDDKARIEKMTDQMIVNLYMYTDALRRFLNTEFLTEEQFARLEYDMICSFDNCKPGCHDQIISIDGKDVMMRWHCAAGEIVRDAANALVYFNLLK
jgi:hypothetical protein